MISLSPYWEPNTLTKPPTLTYSDTQITYPRKLKSPTTKPWQSTNYQCPPPTAMPPLQPIHVHTQPSLQQAYKFTQMVA
jgi:hypothetical protein